MSLMTLVTISPQSAFLGLAFLCILFLVAVFNAYTIIGAFNAAHDQDGEGRKFILNPIYKVSYFLLGPYWSKPVLGCYKCMASLWGGFPMFLTLIYTNPLSLSVLGSIALALLLGFVYTCIVSAIASSIYAYTFAHEETGKYYKRQQQPKENG